MNLPFGLSFSSLAAGFFFGVWGLFLIRLGKKEGNVPPILIGVALIVYPYFLENVYLLWGIGAALLLIALRLVR